MKANQCRSEDLFLVSTLALFLSMLPFLRMWKSSPNTDQQHHLVCEFASTPEQRMFNNFRERSAELKMNARQPEKKMARKQKQKTRRARGQVLAHVPSLVARGGKFASEFQRPYLAVGLQASFSSTTISSSSTSSSSCRRRRRCHSDGEDRINPSPNFLVYSTSIYRRLALVIASQHHPTCRFAVLLCSRIFHLRQ